MLCWSSITAMTTVERAEETVDITTRVSSLEKLMEKIRIETPPHLNLISMTNEEKNAKDEWKNSTPTPALKNVSIAVNSSIRNSNEPILFNSDNNNRYQSAATTSATTYVIVFIVIVIIKICLFSCCWYKRSQRRTRMVQQTVIIANNAQSAAPTNFANPLYGNTNNVATTVPVKPPDDLPPPYSASVDVPPSYQEASNQQQKHITNNQAQPIT